MTKELSNLIVKANKALNEAQELRAAVIDYLEEYYGITEISEYKYFEDECNWCYGLNEETINIAIENRTCIPIN